MVIMSMFGAGNSFANLHFAIKPVMRYSYMRQTVEDHDALDVLVRRQSVVGEWVLVRPAMLKDAEGVGEVVVREEDGRGEGWVPSSVGLGSVVEFMLDCVEGGEYVGRGVVITN